MESNRNQILDQDDPSDDYYSSKQFDVKLSYDMSKEELFQVIESQKKEIRYLTLRLKGVEKEKEEMIENFKLSSSVLLERLKDLEAQGNLMGERPQTASVLSKISAEANGKRIGQAIRGRSKAKRGSPKKQNDEDDDYKVDVDLERVICPNCKQIFSLKDMVTHTVICYRNSTKCKLCGEIILKDKKKEHIDKWKDMKKLIQEIQNDNEQQSSLFFDHGIDVNVFFNNDVEGWTPMHYAAKHGALNVVIALISRGAGVDPPDVNLKTPLIIAIENNKFTVARSLIEFGADVEAKDSSQRTPIMFACKVGSKEMVELLLTYKADIKATNSLGDTCVTFAQKSGNPDIMSLLVRSGASIRPSSRQNSLKIGAPPRDNSRLKTKKMPILLPDCGHSFCLSCINKCFEKIKQQNQEQQEIDLDDLQAEIQSILFKCPDDEINLQESILINKKLVKLDFMQEEGVFKVSKPEDKSLAGFLTSPQIQQKKQFVYDQAMIHIENHQNPQQNVVTTSVQEPQIEECPVHQRPVELICVDDKMRICAQCALFGQHKGHDVRMEEEVTKEISLKVEVIMEMYQAIEQSCDELNDNTNYDRHYNIYKHKQNEIKDKIQDKFKEWRRALRAVEMKVIDSLYVNFQQFEEKFGQAKNHNNKMISEAQAWMDRAKQQLDEYTNKTVEDPLYIPYDMIENKKNNLADEILNCGEQILDKVEKQRGFPSLNGMENSYGTVKVAFDPNVEKKFFHDEEDLNDGIQQVQKAIANDPLNLSNISFNEPASPINNSSFANQTSNLRRFSALPGTQVVQQQLQQQQPPLQSKLTLGGSHSKKKNDLPSTFKNETINGELDISNRNLSDMHSNELAKCIKSLSGPIKILNLSKNRISDDGIGHIIKALCDSHIEQINLQGNKLSEKCVEGIVGCLKTNKTLKVMDLSQNGIGSRLMKNKLKNALPQIEVIL
ncbi:achain crystal structure of engineered northeast structural genomics consortium target [Stylonychia lemnae]|uniref:Achain crystal structure of engineered northeast structural genomics consortium target n=1 Tax=Stylonychia lemnae TaxID=5949 RepID=A0A078BAR4_STYLE|nr:achain crystal structure of engineered northeast structural genomics consortium target [Stylonychia lemnae]|eukprot:CDW91449.1 achain crystal structure of engineered northeast structural genomics consortium target [Stylonychia lemnae]